MTGNHNPAWQLARTPPEGWPTDGDFRWTEGDIPEPGPGQAVGETLLLSLDPYQWNRRRNGTEQPGEVCHGRTVSRVIRSRHTTFREGDIIFNTQGWQQYGLTGEGITDFGYMTPRLLDGDKGPYSYALGALGMLGLTAYAGLIVQCQPQEGETVVVSAASGGVGQLVGQLARILGARVVGIAGTQEKVAYCQETLGFDACISHKDPSFREQLANACPDGCDVYFENVGGPVFDAVCGLLNPNARISLCGMIAHYGEDIAASRARWFEKAAPLRESHGLEVHPLFVGDFVVSHQAQFLEEMGDHVRSGRVVYKEDRIKGLAEAPHAFRSMLTGSNFGKTLVEVQPGY